MRAPTPVGPQATGDGVGEPDQLAPDVGDVVEVVGERLLVADRLDLAAPARPPGRRARWRGRRGGWPWRPPERADDSARGSSAARSPTVLDAHPLQAGRASPGRRPTAPARGGGGGRRARRRARTSNTPGPGRTPSGMATRLGVDRGQLGDELVRRDADRAGQPELVARSRARIGRGDRGAVPSSAPRPVTSRNASSRASGSTSGVTAWKCAWTSRLTAGVAWRGRRGGTPPAGTAAGPSPTASPSGRRSAGPRTTRRRRPPAGRCRRRPPAGRAAPAAGAARPTRRRRPCRRGGWSRAPEPSLSAHRCLDDRAATQDRREPWYGGRSDLSRPASPRAAVAAVGDPQAQHEAHRLADDPLRHLRLARVRGPGT